MPLTVGIAYDLRDAQGPTKAGVPDDYYEELDGMGTVHGIAQALETAGHHAVLLGGGRGFLEKVLAQTPDLVFNIAEGLGSRSREAHVPSVCEMLKIPHTHSDPLTLALSLDKPMAKTLVAAAGGGVPLGRTLHPGERIDLQGMHFPLLAKPAFEGSSMGIRRASCHQDATSLERDLQRLWRDYQEPVLVEEFLPGSEFTVALLGSGPSARVHGTMEIAPKSAGAPFVYSLEVKRNYLSEVNYHVPPRQTPSAIAAVESLALLAYRTLGCRDVARVDIRLDASNQPRFIEINPLPGLDAEKSDIVILQKAMGLTYAQLIAAIVDGARLRYGI